jgi:hypothetical protein
MELCAPGLGMLEFNFVKGTDVSIIVKTRATFIRWPSSTRWASVRQNETDTTH